MLKRLNLNLDLQTSYIATRQKRRPVEPTEKTPRTTIVKGEEEKSRSRFKFLLLLERASLIFSL